MSLTGLVFADRCKDFATAPSVPIGGIRTESIRRSSGPRVNFDGVFDGLLIREPAVPNLARVDFFFGDGSSPPVVSESAQ